MDQLTWKQKARSNNGIAYPRTLNNSDRGAYVRAIPMIMAKLEPEKNLAKEF